ncbi:hypothetical protein HZH68_012257 [Vespula germanica]|uniref:Uncharacterized protein n=1 Tax=Vespula germanica TaxID=30212 RepID=A0A834JHU1_VESGE|nr:hypothetical protein HZH68_012257 [Vespula germanica]
MRDCGFQVGQRATSMAKRGGAGDGGSGGGGREGGGGGGGGGGKKLVRPPRVGPIFNREKSTESIFACRGYFSLRGYPCVRNPKKSRTPYVGKRRAKEEGGSRWKVASERVDGDVPKEGYGISPEFNPYPRCRL